MATIGFIGLGNMGGPMAKNLLAAGHELTAFDIVPALMEAVVEDGASAASDAAGAVAGADVVFSMLPASEHVEDLYLGGYGLLDRITPDTLIVDCSTIDSNTSARVAAVAAEKGIDMLDAPVSGGVGGAVGGTLTFIVGGSEAGFERAQPYFDIMGKNFFHAGEAGAGQVAKMCNDVLLSILMSGTAEALQLGVDNGLDPAVLSEIMRKSSGGNWALEVYNPWPGIMDGVPASREYEGGFLVDLMIKDLGLAMSSALERGSQTPMGSLARNLYLSHRNRGFGRKDFSSIQQYYTDK
ncbi:MAG: 3-hydroxyisobutyrate dehydrogenase [Gammaproteobacteria bacterium]|nr:3-hydroxyisobutyrate dehydrogenase [Gammaproteobacteria bacterium]